MKNIYPRLVAFDLDGTLAESKSVMDKEMAGLLNELLQVVEVAVISGGSLAQFEKQLLTGLSAPEEVLHRLSLFPTCGAMFYRFDKGWKKVYGHELSADEKSRIAKAFEVALPRAGYVRPEKVFGELIEDRGTQVTFSGLGQQAPVDLKKAWDPDWKKRLAIKEALEPHLPDFEVRVAGGTSVDVTRKGIDKAYGMRQIEKHLNIPTSDMLFIGDALFPGGNDYPVISVGVKAVSVAGPHETKHRIKEILSSR